MWVVAALSLLLGAFLVFFGSLGREYRRRARRIEKTTETPIAAARAGELVAIVGQAMPDEDRLIDAPGCEQQVLYYSISIEERDTAHVSSRFVRNLAYESKGVQFLIDDGSGRVARIDPGSADVNLRIEEDNILHRPNVAELAPDVRALLETGRRVVTGATHGLKVTLQTIAPGDRIYALGVGEVEKRSDPTMQYRGGSSVVLALKGWGDQKPVVANTKEDALYLQDLYASAFGVPWKGIALILVGIALGVWLVLRG